MKKNNYTIVTYIFIILIILVILYIINIYFSKSNYSKYISEKFEDNNTDCTTDTDCKPNFKCNLINKKCFDQSNQDCNSNTDCPSNYICNMTIKKCYDYNGSGSTCSFDDVNYYLNNPVKSFNSSNTLTDNNQIWAKKTFKIDDQYATANCCFQYQTDAATMDQNSSVIGDKNKSFQKRCNQGSGDSKKGGNNNICYHDRDCRRHSCLIEGTYIGELNSTANGYCKDKSCFSKDSLLKLENGNTIKIENAKIGDIILSYSSKENKLSYSPIVAIPHEKNNILSKFIKFTTNSGKSIKMTEKHLIPVLKKQNSNNNNNNSFDVIFAEKIEINDIVKTVNGNEQITSIEIVEEEGIYTVITLEEYIVVDNIIASPYAIFHLLGNIYYSLHKNLYSINPKIIDSPYFKKFNQICNSFYNGSLTWSQ